MTASEFTRLPLTTIPFRAAAPSPIDLYSICHGKPGDGHWHPHGSLFLRLRIRALHSSLPEPWSPTSLLRARIRASSVSGFAPSPSSEPA